MAKSLTERIASRAKTKTPRQGKNRATVLALRGEIQQALDDGWSLRLIWETLKDEGKVAVSYQGFCGYVRRLVRDRSTPPIERGTKPAARAAEEAAKPGEISGFTFNSTPKKEDLL